MNGWKLVYEGWKPNEEPLREALCTLGNGYIATRGAVSSVKAGGAHYPGTYLAGGYNRLESEIAGRVVENEDLVNWPNWTLLTFRFEGEDWFALESVELLEYRQELDLEEGVLNWLCRFRDAKGRETALRSRRIVHMADMHMAAIEWTITAENWSGRIEVRSALDGRVENRGVARYRDFNGRHLEHLEAALVGDDGIYLLVQTNQSRIEMAQAARTRVYGDSQLIPVERTTNQEAGYIEQLLRCDCEQAQPVRIEKIVAIYTSRDWAISSPGHEAAQAIERAATFAQLLRTQRLAWRRLWYRCDIELEGAPDAQLALRVHIFHLLQTVSLNTIELDVGVPARGLHGEAYRGHIFWDEIYIFPFLNLRVPEIRRAVSVAERQQRPRRKPSPAFEPAVRALDSGPYAPAAPCERGDCPSCVGALSGDGAAGVHLYLRCENDLRDRPLLGEHRYLQPRPRSLRDSRGGGAGRIPHRIPGRQAAGDQQ